MHLLFLCGGYFPDTSATGNCVRQIADSFTRDGHRVSVICKNGSPGRREEFSRGQAVLRITNRRLSDGIRLETMERSLRQRIGLFLYKCFWAVYGLLMSDGMDRTLVDAYEKACEEIEKRESVDVIIPCCMPAECLKAALRFSKNRDVRLFPLLYDQYSGNTGYFRFAWNQKLRRAKAEKLENAVFSRAEKVFYVDNWRDYFQSHPYPNAVRVEHPLVIKREKDPCGLPCRTQINAMYQGEINHQMRPPQAMLRLFDYFAEQYPEISLHICAYGNSVPEVERYAAKDPRNVFFYGTVGKDRADALYDSSDVAVVLGNKNPELVPSKIFECIASGLPVVYFYYTEEEKSFRLLEKYPLVLPIRQEDHSRETYDHAAEWIRAHYLERVDFDTIIADYADATPDYVVQEITKSMRADNQR